MKINAKTAELAVLAGMAFSVFCAGFCGFAEDCGGITETVFRLHIPANSDSDADQRIKLKVRDAVLEGTAYIFEGCGSSAEAAAAAEEHLDEIKSIAERVLAENGADYGADCEVAKASFDTRVYGDVTVPAGEYSALRIKLGDAEGKNWWCVMFPPLCLPAVTSEAEVLDGCGALSPEETDILVNPENYEVKFYFLELLDKIRENK